MEPKIITRDFPDYALHKLFSCVENIKYILRDNGNITIAGGAILWALGGSSSIQPPDDVDFFILKRDHRTFAAVAHQLDTIYPKNKFYERYRATLTIRGLNKTTSQLILCRDSTAEELISQFDFDYIQCALIYSGGFKLLISNWALEAHATKVINHILNASYNSMRLYSRSCKALNKGFKFPPRIKVVEDFGVIMYDLDKDHFKNALGIPIKRTPAKDMVYNDFIECAKTKNSYTETLRSALDGIDKELPLTRANYGDYDGDGEAIPIEIERYKYKVLDETLNIVVKSKGENKIDEFFAKEGKTPFILTQNINFTKEVEEETLLREFNKPELSDFKIISQENKEFFVHRILLSQVPYFNTLLRSQTKEVLDKKVVLPIASNELEFILIYIYGLSIDKCFSRLKLKSNLKLNLKILQHGEYLLYPKLIKEIWHQLEKCIEDCEEECDRSSRQDSDSEDDSESEDDSDSEDGTFLPKDERKKKDNEKDKSKNSEEHSTSIDINDLTLLIRLGQQYKLDIPVGLNIDDYITSPNITADNLLYLFDSRSRTDKITLSISWIISHLADENGHKQLLGYIKIKDKNDLKLFYDRYNEINTKLFADFVIKNTQLFLYPLPALPKISAGVMAYPKKNSKKPVCEKKELEKLRSDRLAKIVNHI